METADWVRLSIVQARLHRPVVAALEALGGAESFLAAPVREQAEALGGLPAPRLGWLDSLWRLDPAELLATLSRLEARVLPYDDPSYPAGLLDLPDPPPCLFVAGDPACLLRRSVAIVGSRGAGLYGLDSAQTLARGLAESGVCVVSGLAVGIDAAAHRGALEGGGPTAGVLGCGLDDPYPVANRALRDRMAREGGAVLTELPPGTEPSPGEFPRRNRIIAALALVTVVVGAREQSGALITAGVAAELGREVAAVPGSIRDPYNRGAHRLIRDGAQVVDGPRAVLDLLGCGAEGAAPLTLDLEQLSEEQRRVFLALGHQPTHIDALAEDLGLEVARASGILMLLAARGLVEPRPGGSFVRGV